MQIYDNFLSLIYSKFRIVIKSIKNTFNLVREFKKVHSPNNFRLCFKIYTIKNKMRLRS